jgi:FKBP-type peptidyl-prolyl cis-trans isomerase FklB
MMKKYNYLALAAMVFAVSCGRTVNPNKAPKTSLDSFSYIVGHQVGSYMKAQGIDKVEFGAFIKGFEEAMKKDSGFTIKAEDMEKIQSAFILKEQEKKIKGYQEEAKKWMAENAKKNGVSTLPSKGQFKVVKAGAGMAPRYYDTVEYSMVVKSSKGKELFNSKMNPMSPRMPISELGLAPIEEAFQKVTEGAVFDVYIQNDLYAGMNNKQKLEDRYGVSIFTIELIKVTPGKAPEPKKLEEAPKLPKQ